MAEQKAESENLLQPANAETKEPTLLTTKQIVELLTHHATIGDSTTHTKEQNDAFTERLGTAASIFWTYGTAPHERELKLAEEHRNLNRLASLIEEIEKLVWQKDEKRESPASLSTLIQHYEGITGQVESDDVPVPYKTQAAYRSEFLRICIGAGIVMPQLPINVPIVGIYRAARGLELLKIVALRKLEASHELQARLLKLGATRKTTVSKNLVRDQTIWRISTAWHSFTRRNISSDPAGPTVKFVRQVFQSMRTSLSAIPKSKDDADADKRIAELINLTNVSESAAGKVIQHWQKLSKGNPGLWAGNF